MKNYTITQFNKPINPNLFPINEKTKTFSTNCTFTTG